MLITFEGIEGCGKTTQINLLENFLSEKNYPYILSREPGGTRIGDRVREILLDSQFLEINPYTELFLYLAARVQHVKEVIEPALKRGKIVLCDRFIDATIAYQGFGHGIDLQLIEELNTLVTRNLKPEITFLIDLPVEISLRRAWNRIELEGFSAKEDRFERKDLKFHQRVREGYLQIARKEPDRIKVIDGSEEKEFISQRICRILEEKLERWPLEKF